MLRSQLLLLTAISLGTLSAAGYVAHVSRSAGYALTEKVLRLSVGLRERDAVVAVGRRILPKAELVDEAAAQDLIGALLDARRTSRWR